MKILNVIFLLGILVFFGSCCETKKDNKEAAVVTEEIFEIKEDWNTTEFQGTVTAVNAETREVTLIGLDGKLVSIVASEMVERFDEIKVGDVLTVSYLVYMMAEFRNPTPEEIAEPLVIISEVAKVPENIAPAGAVGAMIKGIVTIEVLNRPSMLAVVKGPKGNFLTINVKDVALMERLHIGQQFILTYAEVMTANLSKATVVAAE